jgi:hypothetical protein
LLPYIFHSRTETEIIKILSEFRLVDEKNENAEYWEDLTTIVEDELKKLKKIELEKNEYQAAVGRRDGIHQSVVKDVTEIFKGKSTKQLDELKTKIEGKILNQRHWVLGEFVVTVKSLRDKHQENLKLKLEMLKREQEQNVKKEEDDEIEYTDSPKPGTGRTATKPDEESEGDSDEDGREMTAEMIYLKSALSCTRKATTAQSI